MPLANNDRRSGPNTLVEGQTGPIPFNFKIEDADWLRVTRIRDGVESVLVRTTDYTVSGVGVAAGGSITLTAGATAGDIIVIEGVQSDERAADFNSDGLSDTAMNGEAERLFRGIQEVRRDLDRMLRTPRDEGGLVLPPEAERAGKVLVPQVGGGWLLIATTDLEALADRVAAIDALSTSARLAALDAIKADFDNVDTIGAAAALLAVSAPSIVAKNASGVPVARKIVSGNSPIVIDNGDGGAGNPVVKLLPGLLSGVAGQAIGPAGDGANLHVFTPAGAGDTLKAAAENLPGIWAGANARSLAALKARSVSGLTGGELVWLDDGGRSGAFRWRPGDQSASVAADPESGLTVAPNSGMSGASGAWERVFSGAASLLWWGAAGDCTGVGVGTDDSAALQAAFDWLTAGANRALNVPAGYRFRLSSTCVADWGGQRGGRLYLESPITPDPGIGNAIELLNANDVEFKLWVHEGGQTANYSQRDPAGADQAFMVRGVRGGLIGWRGHNYKGRVMRITKERIGEPKTSRLTIPYAKTGDYGAAACGQNYYFDAGSAFGAITELSCFWDTYGPVAENVADLSIGHMDGGWNAGNNGMEFRGVVSLWAPLLSGGDETNTVDIFTFKPSLTDTVTHNAVNYTAIADSVGIEPGVTAGWGSYWTASGSGGSAWDGAKHYIVGRNCGNIEANLFAFKGKKGVVLEGVGDDATNSSARLSVKCRGNGEHGVYINACSRMDVAINSAEDEVPFETVGAANAVSLELQIKNAKRQAGVVGSAAFDLAITGKVDGANSDVVAATSVFDVNSIGRDINFHGLNVSTANADYIFDLAAGNSVTIVDSDLSPTGVTVPMGPNLPKVARNVGGYRTQNVGSATVLSGNNNVTVTHGLAVAPTSIQATGLNSLEVASLIIYGITATQFQIAVDADPSTAGQQAVTADRTIHWSASALQSQA